MSLDRTTDLARRSLRARRLRDAALALPVMACFLLFGPLAQMLRFDTTIFGIPTGIVVLFGGWLVLILVSRWLARRLQKDSDL